MSEVVAASTPASSPLLNKTTCVVLKDGRQVIGQFGGFDSDGNVLLATAVLKKLFKSEVDGEERVITRLVSTFMVPFDCIAEFFQTDKDFNPNIFHTN